MEFENLREFEANLGRFAEELMPEQHVQFQQAIAMQALPGVVQKTPVDIGRAKGNWQTTLSTPADGETAREDKGGNATISAGSAVIERLEFAGTVWLSNNLPYIGALEDGSSGQAPNGMVRVTLGEIEAQFR